MKLKFAIVGRTNKGKSSIVATLVENDDILIRPTPRTTRVSQDFNLKVGDKELFTIVDTPGFEEAPAMLEWLKSEAVSADQRRQRIEAFYNEFKDSKNFGFECEILKSIRDAAAMLYVVDGSLPYRPNFEAEFEILRWTGVPAIALINQAGDGQFLGEWQAALDQYFRKTLHFNAHTGRFAERMRLFEELRFLTDSERPKIDEAIRLLTTEHQSRLSTAYLILADLIIEGTKYQNTHEIPKDGLDQAQKEGHIHAFQNDIRALEKKSRADMDAAFRFQNLQSEEPELHRNLQDDDLFSEATWRMLGRSRLELIAISTAAGALAGGTVDAMVGGASFLTGTALGAISGIVAGSLMTSFDPGSVRINISDNILIMGPNKNANFPWILLDRGLIYLASILRRTHAQRGPLEIREEHSGPSASMSTRLKAAFTSTLNKTWNFSDEERRKKLAEIIEQAHTGDSKRD